MDLLCVQTGCFMLQAESGLLQPSIQNVPFGSPNYCCPMVFYTVSLPCLHILSAACCFWNSDLNGPVDLGVHLILMLHAGDCINSMQVFSLISGEASSLLVPQCRLGAPMLSLCRNGSCHHSAPFTKEILRLAVVLSLSLISLSLSIFSLCYF